MSEIAERTTAEKLQWHYDAAPQRSPEWLKRKRGKIGASKLEDWMATSKAKATLGKPLKARLDYEKELMFERQFDTNFEVFVNAAMQEGIDYEDFAREQFGLQSGLSTCEVGCWYNDFMVVSPDRLVFPKGSNVNDFDNAVAILEIKIVKDNTFTDILMADPKDTHAVPKLDEKGEPVLDAKDKPVMVGTGVPEKHWKQMQSQMWATGLHKGYYVALNFNTKKFVIIEVEYDPEFIEYVAEAIQEELVTKPFALDKVYAIQGEIPDWSNAQMGADLDRSDSNVKPDWSK
jgi:hypothetical protein